LDSANKNADAKAINAVIALRNDLINRGVAPHEAIIQASQEVAELKGWGQTTQTDNRKEDALRNAIKTNEQQPPALGGVGNRAASGVSINDLDQTEYEKLPEAQRKALLA